MGQVIGFRIDADLDIEELLAVLKESERQELVQQVTSIIAEAKQLKSELELRSFFKKDMSQIQNNRGEGTIYAIDYQNAPEVNEVERIFGQRDKKVAEGEIPIILPEEEAKKHQKDPKIAHIWDKSPGDVFHLGGQSNLKGGIKADLDSSLAKKRNEYTNIRAGEDYTSV